MSDPPRGEAPLTPLLTEEELMTLQDQLLRKQRELSTLEDKTTEREMEYEERLIDVRAREIALTEREAKIRESRTAVSDTRDEALDEEDENSAPITRRQLREIKNEIRQLRDRSQNETSETAQPVVQNNLPVNTQLSLKDLLESVPTFNGSNIPILKFTRACKRAKDMLAPALEPTFTRLLRNELKDRAYTAIEDDTFRTVSSFTDRLKEIFGASRSVNQYKGELGNVAKGKTEHVLDYISRVKDIHSAIVDREVQVMGRLSRQHREALKDETMECFVAGLPPDFRLRLKFEGYVNLNAAYKTAIKVEKEMERDKVRFQEAGKGPKNASAPSAQKDGETKSSCNHCQKSGHVEDKWWVKDPSKRPQKTNKSETRDSTTQPRNPANSNEQPKITCTYCSRPNHNAEVCYKRLRDVKNSENAKQPSATQGASRKDNATERPVNVAQTFDGSEPSTSA